MHMVEADTVVVRSTVFLLSLRTEVAPQNCVTHVGHLVVVSYAYWRWAVQLYRINATRDREQYFHFFFLNPPSSAREYLPQRHTRAVHPGPVPQTPPQHHRGHLSASGAAVAQKQPSSHPMDDAVSRGLILSIIGGLGLWLLVKPTSASPALVPSLSLKGKSIIVTGANSGVGFAASKAFAARGARVIMACRDVRKGEAAAELIRNSSKGAYVEVEYLDVSKIESIQAFVNSIDRCHVLVNNAGLMEAKPTFQQGLELTMLTNHLGPFLLTHLLLPVMRCTSISDKTECRIINVASRLERVAKVQGNWLKEGPKPFNTFTAYANSKLCNLLSTFELSRRLADDASSAHITVSAMTPGMVRTNLGRFAPWWQRALYLPLSLLLRHPDKGAETIVFMAEAESLRGVSGRYFFDCREIEASEAARSLPLAKEVWVESCRLMGVRDDLTHSNQRSSKALDESDKAVDMNYL